MSNHSQAQGASGTKTETDYGSVYVILAVLVFTGLVMILNETTLSIALPAIMEDYKITAATAQWLLTGFMLTMAVVLPTTGWMLDRFTTRTVFLFAVVSFLIGTIIAAVAPTFMILLLGRVAQAVGTSVIMPLLMTVTMTLVPFERRGTVMGFIGVVMAAGPATGPTVAGLVLSVTTWHGIFWVMVPLVVLTGIIGGLKLRNISEPKATPLDAPSVVLSVIGFGGLVYGFSSLTQIFDGGSAGLTATVILILGVIGTALFVWRQIVQGKRGQALLNLEPLRIKNYTISLSVMVILFGAMIGVFSTLPLFMQGAMLVTALVTGMALLPGGLLEGALSPVAGRIFDRFGPKPLIVPGMVISFAVLLIFSFVDENVNIAFLIVLHVIFSVALAMIFTPLMTTGLGSLPTEMYSHGSAILGTLQQLGAAAGTAVMLGVYSGVSLAGVSAGKSEPVAIAGGTNAAFLISAGLVGVATVLAFFIRRVPAAAADDEAIAPGIGA